VIGAVLGGVTGYLLSNLVESGGSFKILIWAFIGATVVSGLVFVFELFVREWLPSPLPVALVSRGNKRRRGREVTADGLNLPAPGVAAAALGILVPLRWSARQ